MTISRTRLAAYLVSQPTAERQTAIRRVAAWLVGRRQTRRRDEVVAEAARLMAQKGHLFAQVTTARPLPPAGQAKVTDWLRKSTGARSVEIQFSVNPRLVGGLRLDTPDSRLDVSLAGRLNRFMQRTAHE